MPPIGDTLREARMRQRLDIADVEARTKIRAKYLRALENEEWSLLPGPTFVKTFLRTYAEVVGVDPHLLVEEYRMSHEHVEEQDIQPLASPRSGRREARRDRRRGPGPPRPAVLLGIMGVALVAFLLVLGLSAEDDGGDGDRRAEDTTPRTETTARQRPPKRRKAPPRGVTLRITPTVPTYACLDTGDGTDVLFEGTLEEPQTFRDPRRVRVNLGKRSVEMRANGKPVSIAESPQPVGFDVTRSGAEEIVDGPRPCA